MFMRSVMECRSDDRNGWIAAANAYRGELLAGLEVPENVEQFLSSHRREPQRSGAGGRRTFEQGGRRGCANCWMQRKQLAERLLRSAPASEEAHRALMRIHLRRGRTNAALRQFEQCKAALTRELQAEPDLETRQLFRLHSDRSTGKKRHQ